MHNVCFDPDGTPIRCPTSRADEARSWVRLLTTPLAALIVVVGGVATAITLGTTPSSPAFLPATAFVSTATPSPPPSPPPFEPSPLTPLAVLIITPQPTIPLPATATTIARATATAKAKKAATEAAQPKSCDLSPSGALCVGQTPVPTMPPPLPTTAPCLNPPIPNALCIKP